MSSGIGPFFSRLRSVCAPIAGRLLRRHPMPGAPALGLPAGRTVRACIDRAVRPLRSLRGMAAFLILLTLTAGLLAWLRYENELNAGFSGYPEATRLVVIPPGSRTRDILRILEKEGIIRNSWPSLVYLWWNRGKGGVHAGEYQFQRAISAKAAMNMLLEGRVFQHALTIPEGWNRFQIAGILEARGMGTKADLLKLLEDPAPVRDLDARATSLEGYLFPDTYFYTRGTSAREMILRLTRRFSRIFDEQRRKRAAELGWSIREVVTLASLIEKETALPSERPMISSVFHRRLKEGMRLQCDPTVIYASTMIGKFDGVIRQSDLALHSPYNTYQVAGLPAGPIASPGLASLDAALNPAQTNFLYFVARKDGSHQFSASVGEHNRAVALYRR